MKFIQQKNNLKYIKVIIVIILLYISYNIRIIFNWITFFLYINSFIEFKKVDNYLYFCKTNKLEIIKNFKNNKINPKISIISPVYNREIFILKFLKSIQNQNFNDFELIFVDDCSKDNSVKIIEENQKKDRRIVLIKNKKNKGTFINRNIGVILSKGNYLILPDPDDIISKNIIKLSYKLAIKYNYEMIRFNIYIGKGNIIFNEINKKILNIPIYQPTLSYYLYYGINELHIIDCFIHNKLIKKETFIKALNLLNKYYSKIYMIYMEDSLINYSLHRVSKSYYFLRKIGYYYTINNKSIIKNLFKISKIRIKFIFIYLKLIFQYSKNTKFEKDMANLLLSIIIKRFDILTNIFIPHHDFKFYNDVIKLFINNRFITNENKKLLKDFIKTIKVINKKIKIDLKIKIIYY